MSIHTTMITLKSKSTILYVIELRARLAWMRTRLLKYFKKNIFLYLQKNEILTIVYCFDEWSKNLSV